MLKWLGRLGNVAALLSVPALAAGGSRVLIMPVPSRLIFAEPSPESHTYTTGDVMVSARVLGPFSARVQAPVSATVAGTPFLVAPGELLIEAQMVEVSSSLLMQRAQSREPNALVFCTFRAKSLLQRNLFGQQDFERCLIDRDGDDRFDTALLAGGKSIDQTPIAPTAFTLTEPEERPGDRLDVAFAGFAGKKSILLQTTLFADNAKRGDLARILAESRRGRFDYQGGPDQGGRCFVRRPDDSLRGDLVILGSRVHVSAVDRAAKTITATIGKPEDVAIFVASVNQKWLPADFGFCGDETP